MKLRWPLTEGASSVVIDTDFKDFDLTDLFPVIGAAGLQTDYTSQITGQTKLSATSKDLKDLKDAKSKKSTT